MRAEAKIVRAGGLSIQVGHNATMLAQKASRKVCKVRLQVR